MAGMIARSSTQTLDSMFHKQKALVKAYHRKSSLKANYKKNEVMKDDGMSEPKNTRSIGGSQKDRDADEWWVPDDRTGIYHPKGQQEVLRDIPPTAATDLGIHWFS